jgi:hypothetical protein
MCKANSPATAPADRRGGMPLKIEGGQAEPAWAAAAPVVTRRRVEKNVARSADEVDKTA